MPPLPLPMVIDRARGLALGARCRRPLGAGQPDVHGPARAIELDALHRPRCLHPQDRRVQLPVPHRPTSSASSAGGTIAGGVSDGHVTHTRPGRATQVKGASPQTVHAGGVFYESPTDVHSVSRNASETQPAKLLVFYVKANGAPPTVHLGEGER